MRKAALALACCLGAWAAAGAASTRPLVSVLVTCSALAPDTYPADTQNWFDGGRSSQVVFFTHLLFPVDPSPDEADPESQPQEWHPPMAVVSAPFAFGGGPEQEHYAEAEWLDPTGKRVALYGMTLTARPKAEWVTVDGRAYMPHTFAMAIGTRDLRAAAGQVHLPDQKGQYTVRLRVDGRSVGLAFFRMLSAAPAAAAASASASGYPAPRASGPNIEAMSTPEAIPTLEPLKLP